MTDTYQPQGAHLVGSINALDAETAMRAAAGLLGAHLRRIPDGEVGVRANWIQFQLKALAGADGIEMSPEHHSTEEPVHTRPLRLSTGTNPATVRFARLGYADAALESYETFRRLVDDGIIAGSTRFQVGLPTPLAVVTTFFPPEHWQALEPVYRDALYAELDRIIAGIPHESLAIQWDSAVEFQFIENIDYQGAGHVRPWWGELWSGLAQRAGDQAAQVPDDVEVGFHLCYGDAGEMHFTQPVDTTNLVKFANGLLSSGTRPISWLHLPVPIDRDDAAYFAPLAGLTRSDDTELYLGVIHRRDGVPGASRRVAAAAPFVDRFGVATECGCGRAPRGAIAETFRLHAEVARRW